jgi:AraC-like DNA-binding protein
MTPSKDFASAAMLRLIHLGLRQQGLVIDSPVPAHNAALGARVPLSDKRALVHQLHEAFGSTALLRMGQAIQVAPDEPALVALSMAHDPADLVARWQRLERFVHSRHRVQVSACSDSRVELLHRSLHGDQTPSSGEDLLIFGLLVALINRMGVAKLRARFLGEHRWRWQGGAWQQAPTPADTSRWQVEWSARVALDHSGSLRSAVAVGCPATPIASAAALWLGRDPGRAWSVAALAEELSTSPRQLQRVLQSQQVSFTALRSQARLAHAAKCLVATTQSAAEIGYACGFADQAHFNREFKRHSAFTPLAYRQHFTI